MEDTTSFNPDFESSDSSCSPNEQLFSENPVNLKFATIEPLFNLNRNRQLSDELNVMAELTTLHWLPEKSLDIFWSYFLNAKRRCAHQ